MDKPEYCTVIKFLVKGKAVSKPLHATPLRDGIMSFSMEGPASMMTTVKGNLQAVLIVIQLVMEDAQVKVCTIAAILHISVSSVETILHDHLLLSKVSA